MVDNSNENDNLKVVKMQGLNEYIKYCKDGFSDSMIFGTIGVMNILIATYIAITNENSRGVSVFLGGLNLVIAITKYISARRFKKAQKETEEDVKELEEEKEEELRVK